ncbi:repressor of the inhibitor of the protein kinase [Amphibalanus amphitrite]|uniref:Repressor of the inhibitor of the protein kinase n=1 Tax=Amphibalanus amphitrite TaxID=1232801 RepID=A0A6A4VAI4_AMPAM|nr:repressor of the inhibitor of the protein kinase [Amphibalanus amphitrite]
MKKHRLPKMCPTRFVERHTALERFVEQLPAVVEVLRHIETWTDPATSTKAGLLLNGLLKSEVMVGLFVLLKASCILLPPSRALQEKGADLVAAVQLLDGVLEELGRLRQDNAEFLRIFLEAEDAMMAAVGTKIRRPRVSKGKNAHRASASTSTSATGESNDSPEEYFRVNLFAPALDHLLVDLKGRFGEQQRKAMTLTNLVSSRVLNASWGDVQPAWRKYGHLAVVSIGT